MDDLLFVFLNDCMAPSKTMKDLIDGVVCLTQKHKIIPKEKQNLKAVRITTIDTFDNFLNQRRSYSTKKFKVTSIVNRRIFRNFTPQKILDLHGYTRDQAFNILGNFLLNAQKAKLKQVLIITGGNAMKKTVIRENFRQWIEKDFYELVASYSQAKLEDGGQGAFYVIVRTKSR